MNKKILKWIGIGFLGFFLLLILIGFMLPTKVHVERSIEIKAPAAAIHEQISKS